MTRKFNEAELVIATHNKGKMTEFAAMFGTPAFKITCAADHGLESPPETGTTFRENAVMKALFVAQATGKVALADDSGVCVDALGGAPGVYTADWAEEKGPRDFDYAMNKINTMIGDSPNRRAYFASILALAWPDGHVEVTEGYAHGDIVWPPRGNQGHGCDPIFKPDGYEITYAEMDEKKKNAISHRAQSFQLMMDQCFR